MSLLDLPPEILVQIFIRLPHTSLAALLSTCQSTYDVISSSVTLQYLISLDSSSHSSHPSNLTIAERHKILKQKEDGWLEWKVKKKTTLNIDFMPSGIYELTCGVFLLGEAGFGRITQAAYWADLRAAGELKWNRLDLKSNIVDLAVNIHEWDLIAVITSRIVARGTCGIELSLLNLSASKNSTAVPHPLAAHSTIPVLNYPARYGHCRLSVEVVGDKLALLIIFPYSVRPVDKLYIFNWKSGKLLFTRQAERLTYHAATFLSEDVLVLPNVADNTLELCSLSHSSITQDEPVEVFSDDCDQINPDFATAKTLHTTVTLQLPTLAATMQTAMISCRGEPTPYNATFPDLPNPPPFRPRSEDAIIIFDVGVQDDAEVRFGEVRSLSFIVHRYALLALLEKHKDAPRIVPVLTVKEVEVEMKDAELDQDEASSLIALETSLEEDDEEEEEGEDAGFIPWAEWGPPVTRWFIAEDFATRWITTNCGQRWVTIEDGRSPIYIRDFNPVNIKRVIGMLGETRSYETDSAIITIVEGATCLSAQVANTFAEYVESQLPYLEIKTKESFDYTSVFMSENWLLGVVIDVNTNRMSSVDVFSMVE